MLAVRFDSVIWWFYQNINLTVRHMYSCYALLITWAHFDHLQIDRVPVFSWLDQYNVFHDFFWRLIAFQLPELAASVCSTVQNVLCIHCSNIRFPVTGCPIFSRVIVLLTSWFQCQLICHLMTAKLKLESRDFQSKPKRIWVNYKSK